MRILFLNHNYENYGTFFRCQFLARHLCMMGHNVDLVCASSGAVDLRMRHRRLAEGVRLTTLPRIRIHRYHTGHTLRALLNAGIALWREYDVLHSFAVAQPATALPTVAAWLGRSRPIIVDWDDAWGGGLAEEHPSVVGRAISYLEREVPKVADAVTVASQYLEEKAVALGFRRVVRIPNGANVSQIIPEDRAKSRSALAIPLDTGMLVSLGHTYGKSMEALFEAASAAARGGLNVTLYMVGRVAEDVVALARRRGTDALKVVFTGEVPYEEAMRYLAAADGVVLPMEDSVFEKARSPIRLGDYLASGRAIISNAVGEVRVVLAEENCGLTCDPGDVEGFAQNMVRVLTDQTLKDELGARAKAAAEKYSWKEMAFRLVQVYEGV